MKKNVLQLDFEYEFTLFSIVSPLKDYRICWHLNKIIHGNFLRKNDLEINIKKLKKINRFSLFNHTDAISKVSYNLVSNKNLGTYLVKELKQIDFFLIINGYISDIEKKDLLTSLKGIDALQTVFETDPAQLPSRHNLILDEFIDS